MGRSTGHGGLQPLGTCSKVAMGWDNYELGAEVLRGRYISTRGRAAALVWDNWIEGDQQYFMRAAALGG